MRFSFLSDVSLTIDSISTIEIERRNGNEDYRYVRGVSLTATIGRSFPVECYASSRTAEKRIAGLRKSNLLSTTSGTIR